MDAHQTYLKRILMNREEFLVIGLTGRVGAGCSEVADVFSHSFSELNLPSIFPGMRSLTQAEQDQRTLYQYARFHWLKFDVIRVRTVITSFLMKDIKSFLNYAGSVLECSEDLEDKILQYVSDKLSEINTLADCCTVNENLEHRMKPMITLLEPLVANLCNTIDNAKSLDDLVSAVTEHNNLSALIETFSEEYRNASNPAEYHKRKDSLEVCDTALEAFSALVAKHWWLKAIELVDKEQIFDVIIDHINGCVPDDNMDFACYVFVHNIIPAVSNAIHYELQKFSATFFTELYQMLGNCLRRTGAIFYDEDEIKKALETAPEDIFVIPRRINHFIKILRHPFGRNFSRPTRIVIDSIKNIFEATYLRERYSAFYLYAISADENIRISRLMDSNGKNMNLRDIQQIGWKEYADKGKDIFSRGNKSRDSLTDEEKVFFDNINHSSDTINSQTTHHNIIDIIRKDAYANELYPFVLQNVGVSIENSDVFISNNHIGPEPNINLTWEIVRNVCLTIYPGLLLPTPLERCMQVAFIAKVNSGCLSRQVGAVVTDADYNILSLGWNDVPCGDVSCIRKNLSDLAMYQDMESYSNYELHDPVFRKRLSTLLPDPRGAYRDSLCGLSLRYCFKDIHIGSKNPMRSRAMHAEEKALADVADRCKNGYLFTTSSPCEMCSKNAKNHRIKKIYYIESYPGISESQYTQSGIADNRAEHILFTGAIGRAYSQMYTPIMPHKDILSLLGIKYKLDS